MGSLISMEKKFQTLEDVLNLDIKYLQNLSL